MVNVGMKMRQQLQAHMKEKAGQISLVEDVNPVSQIISQSHTNQPIIINQTPPQPSMSDRLATKVSVNVMKKIEEARQNNPFIKEAQKKTTIK